MTPSTFLANFRHVVNAPLGVSRLREMVYALAVSGSLCPQLPDDGTGHQLLEQINAEKESRIQKGVFKRSPKLEGATANYSDTLPRIPGSWAWSRLVDLGEINPRNDADDDTLAAFAPMNAISELHNGPIRSEDRNWGSIKKGFTHFADGDVMVAKITPCFENGKGAVLWGLTNGIGAGTTELHVVRPLPGVLPAYIYVFLRSPHFKMVGESHMTGTAGQKRLSTEYFALREFPLPPLEEQKRIVAKVDELMRLCDRLDAQQQEREKLLPLLSRANHTRFVTEPSYASLQSVFQNPGTVFADDLRQTVLSLAVRGILIPQYKSDGTADDLIREISQRKTQLLDANTIPTPSRLPPIDVQDVPFDLPKGWCWIRLESVCELITKGSSPKWQGVNYVTRPADGVMFITSENVGNYNLRKMEEPKFVEAKFNEMEKRSILHRDDILINLVGASIGRSAIWDRDDVANINQAVGIIRLVRGAKAINRRYLLHYLNSPTCLNIMFLNQVETARANISLTNVKEFLVPIPPEAEQQRIATTVDRVFNWISHLEEQQQAREIVSARFAKAAVAAITSTEFTENERMKPPKTEVVTALKVGRKPKKLDAAPLATLLSEQKAEASAKTLWQLSGLEIEAFYRQLKTEIANGWIDEDKHKRAVMEVEDR